MLRFYIMKKIFFILAIILGCSFVAYANNYTQDELIEIDICRAKGTSACYEEIFYKVDNDWARLNYGFALLNEKRIDDAKIEFQNIVNNGENIQIVNQAKAFLSRIEKMEENMRFADYADEGDYLSDLDITAKWRDPNRIKVYIHEQSGKEYLFEEAISTWNNAVSELGFKFVDSADQADIQCYFVHSFSDMKAGVTQFPRGRTIIQGSNYMNPPVIVKIAQQTPSGRVYTETELLSIILHELGHAFGIHGHSKNKNDIMFYSTETYQNTNISNRDINTLSEIYK